MVKTSAAVLFLATSPIWAQPQVVVTGLQSPHKIILTPQGNLLVSETSPNANTGRISVVTRAGARRSLIEGLPSGTEVAGGGSGPTAMALRERVLYVAIGAGDAERRGMAPGTSVHNPALVSSPLFSSILEIRFSADIDMINGAFRMTADHQRDLADGREAELSDGSGGTARISVLTRFPASQPDPNVVYRFANLWGLALSEDGRILYVVDASFNSLARVDTATGRWQRIVRFPPVPNARTPVGPPMIDSVPTSIRIYGNQVLMSFLTGFPFVPGNARVLAVNPGAGTTEPFIFGLTSVTDVLWRSRPGGASQFFVLEFSADQSAQQPPPGRLLRYDTGEPTVAAAGLITPVSLAYDASTQDLYILELRGQILRLRLD